MSAFIEELGVKVTFVKLPFDSVPMWIVDTNIWHPAVDWFSRFAFAHSTEELIEQLTNFEEALKKPMNLKAKKQYIKNKELQINEKTRNIINEKNKECPICMEIVEDGVPVKFTCYNFHWMCETCNSKTIKRECPFCRFDPNLFN